MDNKKLDAVMFSKLLVYGANNLFENRTIVNDLNVFPIPDGDTGDNMYMTISSGCSAIKDVPAESLDDIAQLTAKGMLLGARGNSGVILSRIFSGIAKGLHGVHDADIKTISKALLLGVDESYKAVSQPVEGTILSVYKDAVYFANSKMTDNLTLEEYFRYFLSELRLSLDRTPDLLDVLKEAGVVDSGGAGIVYIAEGMSSAIYGDAQDIKDHKITKENKDGPDLSKFNEDSELKFGYCTEFLLQLQRSKVDDPYAFDENILKSYLCDNGDSVVCFKEGSIIKVHVHTKRPGDILNHCQQYGEYLTLKIENMTLQHNETTIQNNYSKKPLSPKKEYGIVTVASGAGIVKTFLDLGCDKVIEGGQSMNPSTQDFITAFDSINAEHIFVFPNNSNIILTAKQAASMYDKKDIRIIESRSIGEGYAAVSVFDTSSGDIRTITEELNESIEDVKTGHITRATRDARIDNTDIKKDDYLGISQNSILLSVKDRKTAVLEMFDKLGIENYDIALLIQGKDSCSEESKELKDELESKYRNIEAIIIKGDQPVYDYILILE